MVMRSHRNPVENAFMRDFIRWIVAGVTSVAVAALVFVLAAAGFVVAFFVFAVLFVVFGLAIRRARKTVRYGEDGSRFVIYTNIPGADGRRRPDERPGEPHTYELSPDDYTVEPSSPEKPSQGQPSDPKSLDSRKGA